MIVREDADGSLVLINQTDHAKISGLFASHWGNASFQKPHPNEAVVRAAMCHDCGWYSYETGPRTDPATGKPLNFMHVPLDKPQLDAFQWATDWLTEIDPYAGLLINRHRTGLWRGRYEAISYPVAFNAKNLSELLNNFIVSNEARQQQGLRSVDIAEFRTNYRLLQVWDLLSLYFCVKTIGDDYIEPVPTQYGDEAGLRMTLKPVGIGAVQIDPYPFDVPSLSFSILHRRLDKSTFADQAEFRAAYFKAPLLVMPFHFIRAD